MRIRRGSGGRVLAQLAVVEDDDAVGRPRCGLRVRDQHAACAARADLAASRSSTVRAVSGSRLRSARRPAPARDDARGPRHCDALQLATRQLAGHADAAIAQPDGAEKFPDALGAFFAGGPSSTSGSSTFWSTVRCGRMWNDWKTKPSLLRRARVRPVSSSAARSVPSTSTRPASGRSRPAIRLSSVDLPEPDSPTIATYSPGPTASRARRARCAHRSAW